MDAFKMSTRHHEVCPLDSVLMMLSGKWKSIILCRLMTRECRYSELLRSLNGCTRRMLSRQLKQLERDGLIVKRTDTTYVPIKTSYRLTPIGRSLIPVIQAMTDWGTTYLSVDPTDQN